MDLTDFRTLGRSGLAVSPLALGTMTFGNSAWGSSEDDAAAVFDAYVEAGGNFVDTADVYAGGRSEEIVGRLVAERGLRDRVVLATKFTFSADPGNPNASGNGRKNLLRALDGSLRRLGTDYVDVYWVHAYDGVTPPEELAESLAQVVRSGKARYVGLSNVPAWVAARLVTLAEASAMPAPIAVQMEYSLVARDVEREHVPAARALGLGLVPWSPLAGGFLTGKYRRDDVDDAGRLSGPNPFGDTKFTDANWQTLDALRSAAGDASLAQTALAWTVARPGVSSVLIGARTPEQLAANVAALSVSLTPEQTEALDAAGDRSAGMGSFTWDGLSRAVFGRAAVPLRTP